MPQQRRARAATLGILLVVFGAGLAVGAAVDRQVAAADAPPRSEAIPARGDSVSEDAPRDRRMMIERVGLTPEQEVQVDSIVAARGDIMSELQKEYRERYWQIVDSTRSALRRTLTEDQALQYDSLAAENDRRRRPESVRIPRN
jgi:Spy/CpxP family protein refolding chaperone